jgi:hypothetical protein
MHFDLSPEGLAANTPVSKADPELHGIRSTDASIPWIHRRYAQPFHW